MTAARVIDVIFRLPGCAGQAADAVFVFYPGKNGRCSKIIENSQIGMSRHLDSSTTTQMAWIMVQYGRSSRSSLPKCVRSSFGRTFLWKAIWEDPIEAWLGESSKLGMSLCTPWKRVVLVCVCGWHKIGWKETKHFSYVESTQQRSWFGRTNIFPWSCISGMSSKTMWNKQGYCWQLQNHDWIQNFRRSNWKVTMLGNIRISSWSYSMEGHAKKCVERYCELANKPTQQLYKVSTPCIDDHNFKEQELKSVGELSKVCSQIVLKCLYLARIGRPDILWSVNKLARSITKWTKACDKRLNRFISYIHHTCEYEQYCHVGNTAKQCRLGLFQDSDFAGDREDSKSTSGGKLCVFRCHTLVPKSWMCKKQTSVSHSSTVSEIISLDAGLRLDGIPALDLWDLIVAVLGKRIRPYRTGRLVKEQTWSSFATLHDSQTQAISESDQWFGKWLDNVDFLPSNVQSLIRKLCCMCLKTTKLWSRWS